MTVVDVARSQLGARYVWGGKSPASGGFDCSGFVSWAWGQVGQSVPSFTDAIASALPSEPAGNEVPGDVVLYRYDDPGQPGVAFPHCGLVTGAGQTIDAAYPAGVTEHGYFGYPREFRRVASQSAIAAPAASPVPTVAMLGAGLNVAELLSGPWAKVAAVGALGMVAFAWLNPSPFAALLWDHNGGNPRRRTCPVCRNPITLLNPCDPGRRFCAFWAGPPGRRRLHPIRASVGYSRDVEKVQQETAEERRQADRFRGAERESLGRLGGGVDRPPWAVGLSDAQLRRIARAHGQIAEREGWWEAAHLVQGSGELHRVLAESGVRAEQNRGRQRRPDRPLTAKQRAEQRRVVASSLAGGRDLPF